MALLEIANLSVERRGQQLLRSVSLQIRPGEVVALVGPNGAGKTTLLRSIIGLSGVSLRGLVHIEGTPLEELTPRFLARVIGYVPQRLTVTFPFTVRQFLEMSLYSVESHRCSTPAKHLAVDQILEITHTEPLASRRLTELSGGELQRVVLASALVQSPRLLLLDEAAASLDPKNTQALHRVLSQLIATRALGVLMVSHDINAALAHASRIIGIKAGELVFDGSPTQFLAEGIPEELFEVPFERLTGAGGVLVVPKVQ